MAALVSDFHHSRSKSLPSIGVSQCEERVRRFATAGLSREAIIIVQRPRRNSTGSNDRTSDWFSRERAGALQLLASASWPENVSSEGEGSHENALVTGSR